MRKNYQYHNSTTTNNIREKYNGPDQYTIPLNLTSGTVGTQVPTIDVMVVCNRLAFKVTLHVSESCPFPPKSKCRLPFNTAKAVCPKYANKVCEIKICRKATPNKHVKYQVIYGKCQKLTVNVKTYSRSQPPT